METNESILGNDQTRSDILKNLVLIELEEVYWMETQLKEIFAKLTKEVYSPDLEDILTDFIEESEAQVKRLETIYNLLGESPGNPENKPAECLFAKLGIILDQNGALQDYKVINLIRKIQHLLISSYSTLDLLADNLENREFLNLVDENLEEVKSSEKYLMDIAEDIINECN